MSCGMNPAAFCFEHPIHSVHLVYPCLSPSATLTYTGVQPGSYRRILLPTAPHLSSAVHAVNIVARRVQESCFPRRQ